MTQQGWRNMASGDVAAVASISDSVHGRYTERPEVYAERLHLYPAGCFLFERDEATMGYLICHPWHREAPPQLNAMLGAIPDDVDCVYLHDLALLPAARGAGAGAAATALVVATARAAGMRDIMLVAINGAESFWTTQGFVEVTDQAKTAKLASYGEGVHIMRRRLAD
jgi:N-acetylglutamate synthase-like GNAT family acetyltransferase